MDGDPRPQNDLDFLRSYVAQRDTPCPGCHYNLRGLTSDTCPECAQRLVIGVGLAEPRLGLYLTGLVGLAFGLGFEAILIVWALCSIVAGGYVPPLEERVPLICGAVVQGLALLVWLRSRPRLRRLSLPWRVSLAVLAWLSTALFAGWFFARM